jgi:hypothetical protein
VCCRNHGPLPWKDLNVPFQACNWPRSETAPDVGPTIRVSGTSWTPNLPQYALSRQPCGPNLNLVASHSAVFEFPDELILSVLSHVSPGPKLTGHCARFRVQYYMDRTDYHQRRVEFLLPLSMTCRMMRLRLLPWIWECIEVFSDDWAGREGLMRRSRAIVSALRADPGLGESVKYFYFPSCRGSGLICTIL